MFTIKKQTSFKQVLYLLIFFSLCSCSSHLSLQTNDEKISSIHLIDQNGLTETIQSKERLKQYEHTNFLTPQPYKKVACNFGRNSQGDIRSYITTYHANGQPRQYLEAINSRAHGKYREWFANGIQKLEANVIGGIADLNTTAEESWLFDGESQAWNENGGLEALILYSKGELQGISKYYHHNGTLWKEIPYEKGKIHGTVHIYRKDGPLLLKTDYLKNEENGYSIRFWEKEQIASKEYYQEGLLQEAQYFSKTGQLIGEIKEGYGQKISFSKNFPYEIQNFKNGIPEGLVQVFDENQQLHRTYHIKNGMKHGKEAEYYKNSSQAKIILNWYNGIIQGTTKTWYSNGNLESQREMTANKKHGLLSAWYENGAIMLIEEYEYDRLLKGEYFKINEITPQSRIENGKGSALLFDANGDLIKKISYSEGVPLSQ